jgi:hypothetical protein
MIDRKDGEDLLDVGELPDQLTDAVVVVAATVVVAAVAVVVDVVVAVKMAKLYLNV